MRVRAERARRRASSRGACSLADGRALDAFTMLWTAGVRRPTLVRDLPLRHARDGRVCVDEHLRAIAPDGAAARTSS